MNSIATAFLVTFAVFLGSLIGLNLHRVLPRSHLTKETQDVVRLGTGMLSVLASLVLGLLIATAKNAYDGTDQSFRSYAAEIALLNETLRDYGADAATPRDTLRRYTEQLLHDVWPAHGDPVNLFQHPRVASLLEQVREEIRALKPRDSGQAWLQQQALTVTITLFRQRWSLIEQARTNVHGIVLGILVSWIVAIFISFGLNAPLNGTVVAAFLICSMAIGGSVFLILEMDQPLSGVIRISSWPIENVLSSPNW